MNKAFQRVSGGRTPRSAFDLSHEVLTTGDMGKLYPVFCREVVPGDVLDIAHTVVIRFNPMTAPLLHPIMLYLHLWYVPYRLLWDEFEDFITGGADGTEAPTFPVSSGTISAGTLLDYLGAPLGASMANLPMSDMPRRAYNTIFNEWYRDQTSVTALTVASNNTIQKRGWDKDYFTSALPFQQRGTAPSLPVTSTIAADGTFKMVDSGALETPAGLTYAATGDIVTTAGDEFSSTRADVEYSSGLDVSSVAFDMADFRLAKQTQIFLERNARAGARYTEFIPAHFGNVGPRDDRLDRPEYVGGLRSPVVVSEVLQTSATDITGGSTPQGNLAGHGIAVASQKTAKVRSPEYGLVMGILSVMPKRIYSSQGVERQWIKSTRYDFYLPEFSHLSEQPVYNGELYMQGAAADANVFGYQERYSEMRSAQSMVTGGMRSTFDHWHMAEQFSSLPTLGQTFIECTPRDDPAFAVPASDQMLIRVGNHVTAVRPMPVTSDPI